MSDSSDTTVGAVLQQYIANYWYPTTPLGTLKTPDFTFDRYSGSLARFTYLLTCIDYFIHWPKAVSIRNIKAETVAQAFIQGWISRFGVPSTVTIDQEKQFESSLWDHLLQLLGCKRITITTPTTQLLMTLWSGTQYFPSFF